MTSKRWFAAKRFGWGWTPVTWEGWIVTLLAIGAIFFWIFFFPAEENLPLFISGVAIIIAILTFIAYKTGETPRWRWGK